MLKLLEEEEATTTNHNSIPATGRSYFDEKFKKVKSSLIILGKASHHCTFMDSLVDQTTPFFPALDVLHHQRGEREGLATVAWFPWHRGMSIIMVSHDHSTARSL